MNLPQTFMYEGRQVRSVIQNGEPWLVGKDVCEVLGISNHRDAISRLNDKMKSVVGVSDPHGRMQDTAVISEPGMYKLIFRSNKSEAEAFGDWVATEVLPSIRKTGSYGVEQQKLPQNFIEALKALVTAEEEKIVLVQKIESDKPLVLFAESLQVSEDSILVADLAKLLKQNGFDIGEVRLFKYLRAEGYLIKSGSEYNMPTQRSMELKIMEIKTGSRNSSDGTIKITRTPKVTGKGQIYFINKFKSQMQVG